MDIKEAMEQLRKLPVTLAIKHLGGADAIETVLNELDNKDAVIDAIAEELVKHIGTCPLDYVDNFRNNCDECNNDLEKCWIDYFTKKVEGE